MRLTIPTEPIGSIPRPLALIEAIATRDGADPSLEPLYEEAIRDTIERFEATRSPVIDTSTTREMAYEKIRTRVLGTALASEIIGGS